MVKYPQCRDAKGPFKVLCLINAITTDYYEGRISPELAKKRLIYLIALNKVNGWMPDEAVKRLVYEAVNELGLKLYKSRYKHLLHEYGGAIPIPA